MDDPKFDCWCIVELFGHTKLAGRVTEQTIAGAGLLRLDVPELAATPYNPIQPAFTRYIGMAAIYSITPVSEAIARACAASMRVAAVNVYLALPQGRGVEWDGDRDLESEGEN